jgi:septum formation protein
MIHTRFPIILASQSRARKEILERAGVPFSVEVSPVDEECVKAALHELPNHELAQKLAVAKGQPVSKANPHHLVISADQVCVVGDSIFSKPGNRERAIKQLTQLQSNTHVQYSGVAVFLRGECVWSHSEQAQLTMRELSDQEIAAYVDWDEPFHACGSYHYEAHGKHLFSQVQGSDDVIFGLALQPLLNFLHKNKYLSLVEDAPQSQYHLL